MEAGREPGATSGEPSTAIPILAGLGLLALAACVVVAVLNLVDRRDALDRAEARVLAERRATAVTVQLQQIAAAVLTMDLACRSESPPPGALALTCVSPDDDAVPGLDGLGPLLADPAVRVAQAQARDRGTLILSGPTEAGLEVVVAPLYGTSDERSREPSSPGVSVRRRELSGFNVAVVDPSQLLGDADGSWAIEDGGVVLAGSGDPASADIGADLPALERRWIVSTAAESRGVWRPTSMVVVALGSAAALLLGLADRTRRRLLDERTDAACRADGRAAAIRTLARVVQQGQDPAEILPAMAVQLCDDLRLDGLSLSVSTTTGVEREVFVHGLAPDRSVLPASRRAVAVGAGETLAVDLHRAERSIAVLRVRAGEALDVDAVDLLDVAAEMITSAIVSARSIEQQQEAVNRLEALDELKTSFLGVASHELRTPATAISGLASLLAERWDALGDHDRKVFAQRIATNADSLNGLVQDLLDFARLERGDLRLALGPVDLSATVEAVLTRLHTVWGSHRVEHDIDAGITVVADASAIERIVTNLVSNAVKFSPEGSPVTVTVERDGHHARLVVDDEGPGVPEEERDKIFVRFFRGSGDAVVRTRGVGIGLSVVQDFVSQMGGAVRVERSPAGGARFVVELLQHDRSTEEVADAAST
ncbi:MAG TPA: HAMP domain-containing sensor histidine kinase [Acidimicrobiales bacterium]|nr:HAMP domain-containing sensor histidine kinase [Acidimicrobiales bacterium]